MRESERLANRLANLEARARLNRTIRGFFEARGFVEVEAPIAVPSPGLEVHLDAFEIGNSARPRYLITSPEYQMKRLLAGGMKKIYSLGKVFRRGETGAHHNPEFTMLEWYRAGADWTAVAADTEELVAECARAFGRDGLATPWQRLTVAEATERWAGVRVEGDEDASALRQKIEAAGHRAGQSDAWEDLFFAMFLDHVDPRLGREAPLVLHDWPHRLCALARRKPGDARVVERFEAYAAGLELCNGFGELTDPVEQRTRLEADLATRRARGLAVYPIDERFLAALAEMPPSAGNALGVDRLAMLLVGAKQIADVIPFTDDEL